MIKPNWIIDRIALSPTKKALIDLHSKEHWSYGELENEINKWVSFFQSQKLSKGERVAIIARNSIHLFPILFACGLTGLIYVPLNYRLNTVEIKDILADCTPSIILFDDKFKNNIDQLSFTNAHRILSVKMEGTVEMLPGIGKKESWMMIYTGGTTGKPKGVLLSHEAVNFNAMNTIVSWGLSEKDTTINYMPFFHTGGINALSIPIIMAGGTIVMGDKFIAEKALQLIDEYKATICLFVPTMYQAMQREPYFDTSEFPSMKVFLSGGASCPSKIYEKFKEKGLAFKEGYGLTEAGPNNFFIRPETAQEKVGSVGKSMMFNEVKVVRENGELCAPEEVGELLVKGKHVFTAYWNQEEETRKAFTGNWYRTGDLAKYDENGDYYIVGRKKDMIISGGENIYPQEVEQALLKNNAVQDVAILGIPDEKWGEKVVAVLTLQSPESFDLAQFKEECRQHLASYKIPKEFVVIEELPKTDVGKIDKKGLMKWFLKG